MSCTWASWEKLQSLIRIRWIPTWWRWEFEHGIGRYRRDHTQVSIVIVVTRVNLLAFSVRGVGAIGRVWHYLNMHRRNKPNADMRIPRTRTAEVYRKPPIKEAGLQEPFPRGLTSASCPSTLMGQHTSEKWTEWLPRNKWYINETKIFVPVSTCKKNFLHRTENCSYRCQNTKMARIGAVI